MDYTLLLQFSCNTLVDNFVELILELQSLSTNQNMSHTIHTTKIQLYLFTRSITDSSHTVVVDRLHTYTCGVQWIIIKMISVAPFTLSRQAQSPLQKRYHNINYYGQLSFLEPKYDQADEKIHAAKKTFLVGSLVDILY